MGGVFRFARNKRGVTLIELILTLTLLLIAIALIYSFFTYMHRSNNLAKQQSQVQENVILAKTIIDEKIRKADSIAIGSTDESPPFASWSESIYLEDVDGKGVIYVEKGGKATPLLGNLTEDYSMSLSFERTASAFIEVSIGCTLGEDIQYSIEAEIYLLGVNPNQFLGESGNIIYIRKQ